MREVSHLYDDLENFAFNPDRREMCLYGDPAYPLSLSPPGTIPKKIQMQMQMFNEAMSAVHTSVEWLFGDIINYIK